MSKIDVPRFWKKWEVCVVKDFLSETFKGNETVSEVLATLEKKLLEHEIRILTIKRKPTWKFWQTDNFEVTVRDDGETKTVTIYESFPLDDISSSTFLKYVRYKVLYDDQFYEINSRREKTDSLSELKKLEGKKIAE